MKIDIKQLLKKIQPLVALLKRYTVFLYIMIVLIIFGLLVFRIRQYSNIEPSEDAIGEKLKTVQRPKIDKTVLEKIEQLKDQNIQVQSLFDQARNNPFSE